MLGTSMALKGCFLVPKGALNIIFENPNAILITISKITFRPWITLFRRFTIPFCSFYGILLYTDSIFVTITQRILSKSISLFGRQPIPFDSFDNILFHS